VLYCRDCRQIMTPREADYGTIVHTCPECAASERTDAFMFLTLEDLAKWLK
jgi:DNA-directed RNA polymerase subunit M/transcription elongation factor TFIIS